MAKKSLETVQDYLQTQWPLRPGPISADVVNTRVKNRRVIYKMWPDEAGIIHNGPVIHATRRIAQLARLLVGHLLDVNNLDDGRVDLLEVNDNGDVPYIDVLDHALDIHALIYGETLTPDQEDTISEIVEKAVVLIDTECQAIRTAARIKEAKLSDKFND